MPKVFVSRYLDANSPFFKVLPMHQFDIYHESLIQCNPTSFDKIPSCDWLFFYSKKGVNFALQNESFKAILKEKKIAAMGKATAQKLKDFNIKVDFEGSGHPNETAASFLSIAQGQQVLFPQAKKSRQSIQGILGDKIDAISFVVYTNEMRTDFEIPYCDYLVFTSPLNAATYYNKYALKSGQIVIAIGATTATQLIDLGLEQLIISNHPNEQALAESVWKDYEWNS